MPRKLTISRGNNGDERYVRIQIQGAGTSRRGTIIELSQESFADALFGTAAVDAVEVNLTVTTGSLEGD